MKRYSLGIDYGTNSCRSLLIDLDNGTEVGSTVFNYPSGEMGILLDPKDPHNAIITDIGLAPKNAKGMVEYSATFQLVNPIDMSKASGLVKAALSGQG